MNLCQWTKLIVKKLRYGIVQTNAKQTELEALKLKDLKAKNYIFQAIYRSILETILCKDTSKHI